MPVAEGGRTHDVSVFIILVVNKIVDALDHFREHDGHVCGDTSPDVGGSKGFHRDRGNYTKVVQAALERGPEVGGFAFNVANDILS